MLASKSPSELSARIRPSKSQSSADKLPTLNRLPAVKSAAIASGGPSLVGGVCALDQTVKITFEDGCEFGFNGAWLIDSMPERRARDTYRSSAKGVSYLALEGTVVSSLSIMGAGESVVLTWSSSKGPDDATTSAVPALWLRSWAPSVAEPLNAPAITVAASEHGNLQHVISGVEPGRVGFGPLELAQKPWLAAEMTEPPVFQYDEIVSDLRVHLQFLSALAHPGFAFIDGIPTPETTPGAIGAEGAATIDEVSVQEPLLHHSRPVCLVLRACPSLIPFLVSCLCANRLVSVSSADASPTTPAGTTTGT